MRDAKAQDYWRGLYKGNKYEYDFQDINFEGIINENKFVPTIGISAICGLNGVGKSTVMLSLKDVFGIKLSSQEKSKVEMQKIKLTLKNKEENICIENQDGKRLTDALEEVSIGYYLDYESAVKAVRYLTQDNLDELLSQYEEGIYSERELQEISYLVGKEYEYCSIIEIEDDENIVPYFKVKSQGVEYDSIKMGLGEHILYYFYWFFNKISKSSIVLLEEPETFIGIKSQQNFMNFIAKQCCQKGISTIISTHSPFIINNIREENIYILSRYIGMTDISPVNIRGDVLSTLGLEVPKKGIIYVEDEAAKQFLKVLLVNNGHEVSRLFDIESVDGEGNIINRLRFPRSKEFSYQLIGAYDGDMRGNRNKEKDGTNWGFIFLPGNEPIEKEFKTIIKENLSEFIEIINVNKAQVLQTLQKYDGENYHDWFTSVIKEFNYSHQEFIRLIYDLWILKGNNEEQVQEFLVELSKVIMIQGRP